MPSCDGCVNSFSKGSDLTFRKIAPEDKKHSRKQWLNNIKTGLKITAGQRSMTAEIRQMTADDGFPLFTLTVQKKRSSKQKRMIFSNKDFKRYKNLTFF